MNLICLLLVNTSSIASTNFLEPTYEKDYCLIPTVSLLFTCLFLLLVISINCSCYTKHWLKNKDVLPYYY